LHKKYGNPKYKMQELLDRFEKVRPALKKLGNERAMEIQMQHPQTMAESPGPANEIAKKVRGGISARLAKVSGKKGGTNGRMNRKQVEDLMAAHEKDGELDGGAFLHGLMKCMDGDMLKKMYGDSDEEGCGKPMEPVAMLKGRKKKAMVEGGAGMFADTAPRQNAPAAARVPASGATVAPGAMAPISSGAAPYAPANFKRNTVGMGMCGGKKATHTMPDGTVMPGAKHGGMKMEMEGGAKPKKMKMLKIMEEPKKGGARSARGQKIAKLMKGMGMSLGEASKYLKENPDA
jgi:hypothetical protein